MQQIADWLQKLGLGQYAERFAENDINFAILPDLTDQDLKELGVASLGHRRQVLRAIAKLKDGEPATSKPAAKYAEPSAPRDTAERRQVTVMFSDLVGSTALSARMDPEDLREVISAYQKCVAETVGRFGGFVAKYMGDGVLVYFGYPQAHEDDAERAVRAGLELAAAVGALNTRAFDTSAPLSTPIARFTPSSARWSEPRICARRNPARKARQTRDRTGAQLHATSGRCTLCRNVVAAERWTLSVARNGTAAAAAENDGSANCANGGAVARQPRADDLRGCALDRPDEPGSPWPNSGPD